MAEFSSNAKGNAALTTGIIGTSLGAMNVLGNGGLGNVLGGLLGGGCNGVNAPVNRYELGLENEIARLRTEVSLRDSNIFTDSKISDVYEKIVNKYDAEIACLKSQANQQAVVNAQLTANISCMQGYINTLMGLTKTIIPIGNVCPAPMPEFNSWTAPTATTGA
jgi:hypothetical protein